MANTKPVSNSTAGYCHEIFSPQSRHLALRTKKLSTGTLSCHRTFFLQCGQCYRPIIDSTAFKRYTTTFKKLPIMSPRIKNIITITIQANTYKIVTNVFYHISAEHEIPSCKARSPCENDTTLQAKTVSSIPSRIYSSGLFFLIQHEIPYFAHSSRYMMSSIATT